MHFIFVLKSSSNGPQNAGNRISETLDFKIFRGACPRTPLDSERIQRSQERLRRSMSLTNIAKFLDPPLLQTNSFSFIYDTGRYIHCSRSVPLTNTRYIEEHTLHGHITSIMSQ